MDQFYRPTKRSAVYQSSPWYEVRTLMKEIAALRKINFSIVEQRQQALERLNNIESEAPFGEMRFPNDAFYVCEVIGDWSRKFQQLKSALSYKDREIRNLGPGKETNVHENPSQNQNDAQQAFWNATTSILDQLKRGDGVIDRAEFERMPGIDVNRRFERIENEENVQHLPQDDPNLNVRGRD